MVDPGGPVRVLHSLPGVRPTTNPYLVMLRERLRERPDVELVDFSYRAALLTRYQVFHVHWPETLLGGGTPLRKVVRQLLLVLFLIRMTVRRTAVVRTAHNVARPEGLRRHEHVILSWIDRLTALQINLNEDTAADARRPSVLIPHGHYRDWFAEFPRPGAVRGQIGYAGLIRRYKGVETLLSAFRSLPDPPAGPGLTLRVGGKPSTPELAATMRELSADDPRVRLDLTFLPEAAFAEILSSSQLVVLPYRFMHNSGGVLASLSLDRPVLVPDNQVNQHLAEEVGPGWVHTFEGELEAGDILRALTAVEAAHAGGGEERRPDLSRREWAASAAAHAEAYRTAVGLRR